jgi:hypothetical protein
MSENKVSILNVPVSSSFLHSKTPITICSFKVGKCKISRAKRAIQYSSLKKTPANAGVQANPLHSITINEMSPPIERKKN